MNRYGDDSVININNFIVKRWRLIVGRHPLEKLMIRALGVFCLALWLSACAQSHYKETAHYSGPIDAYVMASTSDASDNKPVFLTIEQALAAAPKDDSAYTIFIAEGEYEEKLTIHRGNTHFVGAGMDKTAIFYSGHAGKILAGASKKIGTTGSSSVTVHGTNVSFTSLSIENRFPFIENESLPKAQQARGTQAVAIKLTKNSDKVRFFDVKLFGHQDTLYTNAPQAVFIGGKIIGNVDYIFGRGNMLFYKTDLVTLGRGKPVDVVGFVTAPSTQLSEDYGLTFLQCRFLKDPAVAKGSVYLGRPWHPTATFPDGRYADPNAVGKTVIIKSFLDDHIFASGWTSMKGTAKGGGKQVFGPETARFFEYQNYGPGAVSHSVRRTLSDQEATQYSPMKVLGAWFGELESWLD